MRKYALIWQTVKTNGTCTVFAPAIMHKRITKAVRKEKLLDDEFRFMCATKDTYYLLKDTVDNDYITFTLTPRSAALTILSPTTPCF